MTRPTVLVRMPEDIYQMVLHHMTVRKCSSRAETVVAMLRDAYGQKGSDETAGT